MKKYGHTKICFCSLTPIIHPTHPQTHTEEREREGEKGRERERGGEVSCIAKLISFLLFLTLTLKTLLWCIN